MRRLALLIAGCAVWLFVAAAYVSADGGPHISAVNNGSGGLVSDNCAGCHRAHTAPAADLLRVDVSSLCLACHNGDGATVDVVDGVQYVPTGVDPAHQGPYVLGTDSVLGALRGGGFSYALIDTSNAVRKTYLSQTQAVDLSSLTIGDSFTISGNFGGAFTTASITYYGDDTVTTLTNPIGDGKNYTAAAATAKVIANALLGTQASPAFAFSWTAGVVGVTGSNATTALQPNFSTSYSDPAKGGDGTFRVSLQNTLTFVTTAYGLMSATLPGPTTQNFTFPSDPALRELPRVGTLAYTAKQPVTSTHLTGPAIVWGNGDTSAGAGVALAGDSTMGCTSCHNPHGNGQYRILRTDPGEDWIDEGTPTFTNDIVTASDGSAVKVPDITKTNSGATLDPTTTVRNYTVLPATTATEAQAWAATKGDYLRRKFPAWNYTNLSADTYTAGWNSGLGAYPTPATPATTNTTTFCIACHTRYNGITVTNADGTSSAPQLVANDPTDTHFTYKHGTQNSGCLMCHVSHGSNAMMTGTNSKNYTYPDKSTTQFVYKLLTGPDAGTTVFATPTGTLGTDYVLYSGDSRLLKANNRGTCQLCHDPTESILGGQIAPTGATPPVAP